MGLVTTSSYDQANAQAQKEPIIACIIEGSPYIFSSNYLFTDLKYDDPGIFYDGTYQYDGLRPVDRTKNIPLIDRKGSFSTISQKLEQWDGKASIETFNLKFVDYQQLLTKLCSPGFGLDEIINKKITILFGYKTISYPDQYLTLFKGYVNNYEITQGAVVLNLTDPSGKRKQDVFTPSVSKITVDVLSTDTIINVDSTDNFYRTILNAKGVADPTVTIGLILNSAEVVTFTNANILSQTQIQVTRAQYGTIAQAFKIGDKVESFIHFNDNPISIALKMMLSGWNGPCFKNIALRGIINTDGFGILNDSITFGSGVDVVRDYGLNIGDFVTISGSTQGANNAVFTVADFAYNNRTIIVAEKGILIQEDPVGGANLSALLAIRSKYDTYPVLAGLSLTTDDVLVSRHEYLRDTFISTQFELSINGGEPSGKTFIETHLFKPVGAYALTQGARISLGATHPPLSQDLTKILSPSNVVDPSKIVVRRGVDTRFFYNAVLFEYAYDVLNDKFLRSLEIDDADAMTRMGKSSVLKIECRGFPDSDYSRAQMLARAKRLLQRYKYAAETISLDTNFGTGHSIDGGDTVVLTDTTPPILKISNTETGERGIYSRVMEVQERTIRISEGKTSLTLLSNNGFNTTDRYGVISGSSKIDGTMPASTTSFWIKDSFGAKFPGAEYKKWQDYQGHKIIVHDNNWTVSGVSTFTLDKNNPYKINLDSVLSFVPGNDYIFEFSPYDDTDPAINALAKSQFVFFDSSVNIASASSNTVFTLQPGKSSRYTSGMVVYVQSPDGTRFSPDVKIVTIVGDVVTIGPIITGGVSSNLGFVPSANDIMQLGGFKDGPSAGYRLI